MNDKQTIEFQRGKMEALREDNAMLREENSELHRRLVQYNAQQIKESIHTNNYKMKYNDIASKYKMLYDNYLAFLHSYDKLKTMYTEFYASVNGNLPELDLDEAEPIPLDDLEMAEDSDISDIEDLVDLLDGAIRDTDIANRESKRRRRHMQHKTQLRY